MEFKDIDSHETYRYTGPCKVVGTRNNTVHLRVKEYGDFWADVENVEVYHEHEYGHGNKEDTDIDTKICEQNLGGPRVWVKAILNNDKVNHPAHYTQGGIECIDALKAATVDKTGIEAVCVANAIKYLWRYESKNGLEDVRKAEWYIKRLVKELEEKKNE